MSLTEQTAQIAPRPSYSLLRRNHLVQTNLDNFSSFLGVVSSKQTPFSVGLVSHIKQRFKIASLLDRCVTSGNNLVREYQRPLRNLCATHRPISSLLKFISFPIRLSDLFLRRITSEGPSGEKLRRLTPRDKEQHCGWE
ncbi:hypothetical protein F2Q69_00052322 [Brassica cretica]|uniref:Uncharacterized protein n=1 Tax=Brassica cretica TaxID=69181 RepID=A0A8S9MWC7_BRACR|nr:hypothetical protein F2Q69_00052322 [Brassica cretica]